MTPEAQRIAIAEACGYIDMEPQRRLEDYPFSVLGIPDYFNDLNAMHDAEERLISNEQWSVYLANLYTLMRAQSSEALSEHATASQRAEAFLRTIGKWEE